MTARYIVGDVRAVMATMPDASVDVIITSPPFLALRSYLPADHPDKTLEIGSEANPAAFIDVLLTLTAEWRRILAPHGSIVIELGDTYSGSGGAGGDYNADGLREGQEKFSGSAVKRAANGVGDDYRPSRAGRGDAWPLPKSLALVPELYRIALAYGLNPLTGTPSPAGRWRVRNVVRWVRPNPPVGALGDKFRPATSDLVVACTAGDRWFDLDAVRIAYDGREPPERKQNIALSKSPTKGGTWDGEKMMQSNPAGAPPLDWWQIVPGGYHGAHYAVWPPALCERPIEAMCPRRVCLTCGKPSRRITTVVHENTVIRKSLKSTTVVTGKAPSYEATNPVTTVTTVGWSTCGCPNTDGFSLDGYHSGTGWRPGIVFDPFVGSGTTLVVAHGHSRDSIGIDLDPRNAELARERLGMFLEVETQEQVA